jgi:RHS repeat-associated protein
MYGRVDTDPGFKNEMLLPRVLTHALADLRSAESPDGSTEVTYLYDGENCIAEHVIASEARQSDANDTLLRKYVFGPRIDEPICLIEVADSNAVSYYHFDALGSVIALSDEDGNTAVLYEYSVYGQVASSDPNHPNRFMFTGREFDSDTGLYYYRARYYNPEIGRFLQTDPIGYADGMNAYRYCANNATSSTDPWGLDTTRTPWAYLWTGTNLVLLENEIQDDGGESIWNLAGVSVEYGVGLEGIIVISGSGGLPLIWLDTSKPMLPFEHAVIGIGVTSPVNPGEYNGPSGTLSVAAGACSPVKVGEPDDPGAPSCCDMVCALAAGLSSRDWPPGQRYPIPWKYEPPTGFPKLTPAQEEMLECAKKMAAGTNQTEGFWVNLFKLLFGRAFIIVVPPNVQMQADIMCRKCRQNADMIL